MDLMDCISCPYVTNNGNCELHMCKPGDVVKCTYWRSLQVHQQVMEAFKERRRK